MATRKSQQQEKGGGMDAVALLKKDHDDVNRMFKEFESADEDRKFELAAEICQALTVHATIEEEIFYPQAREAIDSEDLILEAEVEHDSAKFLIERIQEGEIDEMQLSAMIKVLQEYVGHHINEEQRQLFPKVKRSELDLEAIGRELMARKQELEAELAAATTDDNGTGESMTSDDDEEEEESGTGRKRGGMAARDE